MFETITSYLFGGKITTWIVGGFLALFATGALYTFHDYKTQAVTIQKQTDQIASLNASLKAEQTNRNLDAGTINALNSKLNALQGPDGDLANYCAAMKEAVGDTDVEADKPVSKGIAATLKRLVPKKK